MLDLYDKQQEERERRQIAANLGRDVPRRLGTPSAVQSATHDDIISGNYINIEYYY